MKRKILPFILWALVAAAVIIIALQVREALRKPDDPAPDAAPVSSAPTDPVQADPETSPSPEVSPEEDELEELPFEPVEVSGDPGESSGTQTSPPMSDTVPGPSVTPAPETTPDTAPDSGSTGANETEEIPWS